MITPKPHNTAEEYPIATLLIKETITRKPYETDPTDDEWAIPKLILQRALYGDKTKTRGHPRHYPLREIVNAILYALKTGCPRRQLPHDLPPWKTVYYHFRRWQKRGVLAQIRDVLVEQARAQADKAAPKSLAVDSPSVPSTAKGGRACAGSCVGWRRRRNAERSLNIRQQLLYGWGVRFENRQQQVACVGRVSACQ